ncbi:winged helix-turn-helix transcriptional regulator [Bradyrhizobium genosp. P]|uniref:winged helix-turn-helix transcriptional regulator n=1 Tax=Bradyrhizobium genosp. P TaxID=83641 RepID=UPI003CEF4B6F
MARDVRNAKVRRQRSSNKECSIARAMEVVGDRWSILLLREAYYGTHRFDEFQYYLGVASNILSARLKKFVDLGMMTRVPLPEHAGRYEYVLTEKGRDFFPTYLALKRWGDDWLAEPDGAQVVFRDRGSGRQIEYPAVLSAAGKPLQIEDIEVVAGPGAVPFNRKRFSGQSAPDAPRKPRRLSFNDER